MKFSWGVSFCLLAVACDWRLIFAEDIDLEEDSPRVTLDNGDIVSGVSMTSRGGQPYDAYIGIPYATIPERFEEPQLITAPTSQGILNASQPGPRCPQMIVGTATILGDENCLNLNAYVPANKSDTEQENGYPVMVWVHGGGFVIGSGAGYGPQYFMDDGVIIITINYRLSVFGFLSTGDNVIPGNNGLKDIVVALKWVQKNIKSFGGDPSKVTLFGESAGAVAVHYLLSSPKTEGLFHRAISQSGSALSIWGYAPNPRKMAVELATYLKCNTSAMQASDISSEEIATCLKGVTMEELLKAEFTFKQSWPANLKSFDFVPTMEPIDPVSDLTPLLSEPPISILTRNDSKVANVPWMVGVCEDEGAVLFAGVILSNPDLLKQINTEWEGVAPAAFDYNRYLTEDEQLQVSLILRDFYFKNMQISLETSKALTDVFSDQMFLHGVYRSALETASKRESSPVYMYQYAYQGPISVSGKIFNIQGEQAEKVGHGDEVQHLFETGKEFPGTGDAVKSGTLDEEFSKNMVRLWTSFAIHGEPTHSWGNASLNKWEPISKEEVDGVKPLRWYRIQSNPELQNISEDIQGRMKVWDDLWSKFLTPSLITNTTLNVNKYEI